MSDGTVSVSDSGAKKVDTSELTVGANTVERQRVVLADSATAAAVASVENSQPTGAEYGLVVREAQKGQQTSANSQPVVMASDYVESDTVGSTVALNALNTSCQVALAGKVGAGLFLAAGTLIGTLAPEISYDGGTTWIATLFFDPLHNSTSLTIVFTASNIATSMTIMAGNGVTHARARVSAFTSGTANGTCRATNSDAQLVVTTSIDGKKATYRAGAKAITWIASTTAPTFSIQGSSTKTIRITRIAISATASTGGVADITLQKLSALTSGTSATLTAALNDSLFPTATAVVKSWSVAGTATALGGISAVTRYEIVTAAVTVQPQQIEWHFGDVPGASGLVLRGTSEFFGILVSAAGSTPVADIWIEWTEE